MTRHSPDWRQTSIAILAGGQGTRLRPVVADRPKVMAEINGRPFLTYLLEQLKANGVGHVVLCTGYKADMVSRYFGNRYKGLEISYSIETAPLGTGGALRHALAHFTGNQVLVMNGDSFLDADLKLFLRRHEENKARLSLLLAHVHDAGRYGSVTIDSEHRVTAFVEKSEISGPGLINGGIYLLARELIAAISAGESVSLEKEVLPRNLREGSYGFQLGERFIDIGTPESYSDASRFFAGMETTK